MTLIYIYVCSVVLSMPPTDGHRCCCVCVVQACVHLAFRCVSIIGPVSEHIHGRMQEVQSVLLQAHQLGIGLSCSFSVVFFQSVVCSHRDVASPGGPFCALFLCHFLRSIGQVGGGESSAPFTGLMGRGVAGNACSTFGGWGRGATSGALSYDQGARFVLEICTFSVLWSVLLGGRFPSYGRLKMRFSQCGCRFGTNRGVGCLVGDVRHEGIDLEQTDV